MKLFAYDLETTGTNPGQHSIHQIAAIIVIDGKEKERVEIKMQPNPKAKIDPEALKVANVTLEQIQGYMPFQEGYKTLLKILEKYVSKFDKKDKFFTLGYNNASFDDNFLRGLFLQNGDNYYGSWFWADTLDVRVLSIRQLAPLRQSMENFKLITVARQMGITVEESRLHDAVYDVELTLEIFKRLRLAKAELQSSLHEFEFRQKIKELVVGSLSLIENFRENPAKQDLIFDLEKDLLTIKNELVHE
jgi:DNA polymerase III subunit epsilon